MSESSPLPAIRPAVAAIKPYVPGKPVEEVQRELGLDDVIKLASNENPRGPAPRAVEAARLAMAGVHLYPEPTGPNLRGALAARWGLPADWILPGNGSDEIMRLLAEAYLNPGDRVVVPAPSFSAYATVARLMGAGVTEVPLKDYSMDLDAMAVVSQPGGGQPAAKLIFLCSPNNPTGGAMQPAAFLRFLQQVPRGTLVVLDQAYAEFADIPFDAPPLVLEWPQLVVLRTFSKVYGLAGFRLGYGVARPEVLQPLLTIRDPFSVNNLAQAAGMAALDDTEFVTESRRLNAGGKEALYAALARLGVGYAPTQANFILVELGRPAQPVFQALLRWGVIVRPCASFGLPECVRVTIGLPEQNERFIKALRAVLTERG